MGIEREGGGKDHEERKNFCNIFNSTFSPALFFFFLIFAPHLTNYAESITFEWNQT